jgi:hypothetical protein
MSPRKNTSRLEKHEQSDGVKLLRSLGGAVYVTGTVRRSTDYQGTGNTAGIVDVHCFLPMPYTSGQTRRLLLWEVKRSIGGALSPAQQDYRAYAMAAGISYVCGDVNALLRWLVDYEYLRADSLTAQRQEAMR